MKSSTDVVERLVFRQLACEESKKPQVVTDFPLGSGMPNGISSLVGPYKGNQL